MGRYYEFSNEEFTLDEIFTPIKKNIAVSTVILFMKKLLFLNLYRRLEIEKILLMFPPEPMAVT